MTEKQLAVKEAKALAELSDMFGADAGQGFEEADKDAFAIPFLSILQSGSPQCKRSDGAYIKGAEEGMLFNSVTGKIYNGDVGLVVIPCYYNRNFIEWKPRGEGGGIENVHSVAEAEELKPTLKTVTVMDNGKEKQIQVLPSGNTLSDTRNHYVQIVTFGDDINPVVIGMSSSQIKVSKKWMTLMQQIKINGHEAPMASQLYKLTTVPKSNSEGSWYVYNFEHIEQVKSAQVYQDCKKFAELIKSGQAKVDMGANQTQEGSDNDEM